MHNAYPVGTVWPAKYDPVSGAIRTERALTIWPYLCTGFVLGGLAFIIVPAMPALDGGSALPVALVLMGLMVWLGILGVSHWFLGQVVAVEPMVETVGQLTDQPALSVLSVEWPTAIWKPL